MLSVQPSAIQGERGERVSEINAKKKKKKIGGIERSERMMSERAKNFKRWEGALYFEV